jgi:hypothetical protein
MCAATLRMACSAPDLGASIRAGWMPSTAKGHFQDCPPADISLTHRIDEIGPKQTFAAMPKAGGSARLHQPAAWPSERLSAAPTSAFDCSTEITCACPITPFADPGTATSRPRCRSPSRTVGSNRFSASSRAVAWLLRDGKRIIDLNPKAFRLSDRVRARRSQIASAPVHQGCLGSWDGAEENDQAPSQLSEVNHTAGQLNAI